MQLDYITSKTQELVTGMGKVSHTTAKLPCNVESRTVVRPNLLLFDYGCKGCILQLNFFNSVVKKSGDRNVEVLRDTGCSATAVKLDLVKREEMTGEAHICTLIDGTIR